VCAGEIKTWDLKTGKLRTVFAPKGIETFTRLVLSPDGKTIVTGSYALGGSYDGTIDFWGAGSGRHLRQVKWPGTIIQSLATSADGRLLAAGGYRGQWTKEPRVLRIFDMRTGKELACLEEGWRISSLAFAPDSRLLIVAHCDGRVRILNTENWTLQRELRGGGGLAAAAACPGGGNQLAIVTSVSDSLNKIAIWDYSAGRRIRTLDGTTADVGCMAYSPDGSILVIGETSLQPAPTTGAREFSGSLKICQLNKGIVRTMAPNIGTVRSIAFSPSGKYMACCVQGDESSIRVWTMR
jgi:WD40 repeat protein